MSFGTLEVGVQSPPPDALVVQLARSPRLPEYYQKLQGFIQQERARRDAFHARLSELHDQKVEFINGQAVVALPVRHEHAEVAQFLLRLLQTFVDLLDLGFVGHEKIMISLSRNDYEPDLCYFDKTKASRFERKQVRFPAPNFIAEILSPGTEQTDRGVKFEDYAAHGVAEYWLIDPDTETVEQYGLRDGRYELVQKSRTGVITSLAVTGFEIPIRAVFDKRENLTTLQRILAR